MKKSILLILPLLILFLIVSTGAPESSNDLATIDTTSFALFRAGESYSLQYKGDKVFPIPMGWLAPLEEVEEDRQRYVSSFNYDRKVTAFPIGAGLLGIHISSYEIQRQGSAQAAAGRDVFLVFDHMNRRLRHLGLALGITKERIRFMGCFLAKSHSFSIGDINTDGLNDIGVMKEEIVCSEGRPFYKRERMRWYVFVRDRWTYRQFYDGRRSTSGELTLPLIGLTKNPVDFVKGLYRGQLSKRPGHHSKERFSQRRMAVFKYSDFGPQVIANELIGFQWYQWNSHGDSSPKTTYDVQIVVYRDIDLREVENLYPVVKEKRQDYRYVEYSDALQYLDKYIQECEKLRNSDPEAFLNSGSDQIISDLRNTRERIFFRLGQ